MQTEDVQGGGHVSFAKSSKALAVMRDGKAHMSAKYFHVIGSPFLQLTKEGFIKVRVINYLAKHGMMVSLGSTCAKHGTLTYSSGPCANAAVRSMGPLCP